MKENDKIYVSIYLEKLNEKVKRKWQKMKKTEQNKKSSN